MANWIILTIYLSSALVPLIRRKQPGQERHLDINWYYLQDIFFRCGLLLVVFLLNTTIFRPLDFEVLGKGISLGDYFVSNFYGILITPFILAFTPWGHYPKNLETATQMFGCPVNLLPGNNKELFVFFLFIVAGVLFEELYFRQVAFYILNATLHLQADNLLLLTAALFSFGHLYQGIGGLISSFIVGLILGKIYQYTGSLYQPIFLHLCMNMTIVLLAFRRIVDLKKSSKKDASSGSP
jgi:membrane protease YdiL (CAAX protease family)